MAAPTTDRFDGWLGQKLTSLNPEVDLDVFVEYIKGILETETEEEDVVESMSGILSEITDESEILSQCKVIYEEWNRLLGSEAEEQKNAPKDNFEDTMHNIMEQQTKQVVVTKKVPKKSAEHKAAILAQYSQVSDGEGEEAGGEEEEACVMVKNMNALAINQREKDQRERAKQESDQKKQKDKEDREKQKQKVTDRKDAEKKRTQKGERKR